MYASVLYIGLLTAVPMKRLLPLLSLRCWLRPKPPRPPCHGVRPDGRHRPHPQHRFGGGLHDRGSLNSELYASAALPAGFSLQAGYCHLVTAQIADGYRFRRFRNLALLGVSWQLPQATGGAMGDVGRGAGPHPQQGPVLNLEVSELV